MTSLTFLISRYGKLDSQWLVVANISKMYGVFWRLFPNIDGQYKYIYFVKR